MPRSAPWVDVSGARPAPLVDWYFLGCGADYKGCLADYAAMAGKIPIPPKASLGIWWSHYEAYSAHSIQKDVLSGFKNFSLPLNVLQMDVDWHFRNPRLNPKCSGFNGYDWNTGLFPDPIGYVATVARGNWSAAVAPAPATPLRLILNSHNMLGVDECQAEYTAVAADAGHDVSNGSAVPFNTSDLATMTAMFKHVLARDADGPATQSTRPHWWWTDGSLSRWSTAGGCGNGEPRDNLWMSTYTHSSAIRYGSDTANNRPLVMPRYAQPGQHRYCCGFSGDADADWITLRAEVNMTKTAANILFAWWSHDIGGFRGNPGPEAYARWAQFGALSPLWRSHGSSKPESIRRYWLFSSFPVIREAMIFRAVVSPLLYNLAAVAFDTAVAPVHPVYYANPTLAEAYADPYQYMLGSDILARPVVEPVANATSTVAVNVWLPPTAPRGWVEWNSSRVVPGSAAGAVTVTVNAGLVDVPIFVRAGAVLPLLPPNTLDVTDTTATVWAVFLGNSTGAGAGYRYWDDGTSTNYEHGAHGIQTFTYEPSKEQRGVAQLACKIAALRTQHGFAAPPGNHTHYVELRGAAVPSAVTFNGSPGSVSVEQTHSLARPRGTVLLTPPVTVDLSTSVDVLVTF